MKPISVEVDRRYSWPDVPAPDWDDIRATLVSTEVYALTTVFADGSPHTVPVAGMWSDSGFIFGTGESEQKARNLRENTHVSVQIGSNQFMEGRDIVVRGSAEQVVDQQTLTALADEFERKYPDFFKFTVTEGALLNPHGNRAIVFRIQPTAIHVFTRGEGSVQARYTFA